MKKLLPSVLVSSLLLASPAAFAQGAATAPLSPKYLQWVQERDSGNTPTRVAPDPIDWSHLADNPPIPLDADGQPEALEAPPAQYLPEDAPSVVKLEKAAPYDPRSKNRLSPVRDTRWETLRVYGSTLFRLAPALDNMEINAIAQGIASADSIRLSAMYPAYFIHGDSRPGKSFSTNYSDILTDPPTHREIVAFTSRQGAIAEADLPYPVGETYTPPAGFPEDYAPVLQLQEFQELGVVDAKNRNTIKQLIQKHGAVGVSFDPRDAGADNYLNFSCDDLTHYSTSTESTFEYVTLVGWDDSFSRTLFSTFPDARPKNNGAWLARGIDGSGCHDGGYFWLSYDQYIDDATVYIVKAEDGMRHYGYDDLGHTTSWGECKWTRGVCVTIKNETGWGANLFRAEADEAVKEVAFYTPANNARYEVHVYNLGAVPPPGVPVGKTAVAKVRGTVPYAGYHRVALPKLVNVDKGQWFSIVLKMTTPKYYYPIVTETRDDIVTPEAVVNAGESWHSHNGKTWQDAERLVDYMSKWKPSNIALKAFTVVQAPTILVTSLPNAAVGKAYNATLTAKGGAATWVKTSGTLPPGLEVASDGRVFGTPTKVGTYGFTVKATNATGSGTKAIKITVGEAPTITTTSLKGAVVGTNYSATLAATGTRTISWIGRNLPPGLTLSANGRLTGRPTEMGDYTFTVIAMNNFGEFQQELTLTVGAKPTITTTALQGGVVGEGYSATLSATGTGPITWAWNGKLPDWLTLNQDGVLSGTPTKQGTYTVTAKATNAIGTVTKTFRIVVGERPTITTQTLKGAIVGTNYSATLTATGTKAIKWDVVGGSLPLGITLAASTGRLSGKPVVQGDFTFTVRATNAVGEVTKDLTIRVGEKPKITTTTLPSGTVNVGYSATLEATGTGPITWTVNGKLPDWLTLSESGVLSGTPSKPGTYTVTAKAVNDMGFVTKAFRIVISK